MVTFYFFNYTDLYFLLPFAALNLFESWCNSDSPTPYLSLLNWLHTSSVCQHIKYSEYDPNSPIEMPVCMCVRANFSQFCFVFFFVFSVSLSQNARQINTAGIGCRWLQRLRRLLPLLLRARLRLSVLLVRIRYVRVRRIRVDATPAATKNQKRAAFFLQRFVLEKFNSSGGVDGGVQGRVAR